MDDITRKRMERGAPLAAETHEAIAHATASRIAAEQLWQVAFDHVRADVQRFLSLFDGTVEVSAEEQEAAGVIVDSLAEVTLERAITALSDEDEDDSGDVARGTSVSTEYDYAVIPLDGFPQWKLEADHIQALAGFKVGQTAAQVDAALHRCRRPCKLVAGFALVRLPAGDADTGGAA